MAGSLRRGLSQQPIKLSLCALTAGLVLGGSPLPVRAEVSNEGFTGTAGVLVHHYAQTITGIDAIDVNITYTVTGPDTDPSPSHVSQAVTWHGTWNLMKSVTECASDGLPDSISLEVQRDGVGRFEAWFPPAFGMTSTYALNIIPDVGAFIVPTTFCREASPFVENVPSLNLAANPAVVPLLDPNHLATCDFYNTVGSCNPVPNAYPGANPPNDYAYASWDLRSSNAPTANLQLTMTASPEPVRRSAFLSYQLTTTNNGPDTALAVSLTDILPAHVELQTIEKSQGSCTTSGRIITCQIGDMAAGATVTVGIMVKTPQFPEQLTNTADVASATFDPDTSNNVAEVQSTMTQTICERSEVRQEAKLPPVFSTLPDTLMIFRTDFTWCHGVGDGLPVTVPQVTTFGETPVSPTAIQLAIFGLDFEYAGEPQTPQIVVGNFDGQSASITSFGKFNLCLDFNQLLNVISVFTPEALALKLRWAQVLLNSDHLPPQAQAAMLQNIAAKLPAVLLKGLAQLANPEVAAKLDELISQLVGNYVQGIINSMLPPLPTFCETTWSPIVVTGLGDDGSISTSDTSVSGLALVVTSYGARGPTP